MTIAITGSSGFIGSCLVVKLKELGCDLIEIDIKNSINLSNKDDLKKIKKFDCVIHLAAESFVPNSFLYPDLFLRNNFECTLNILELCRKFSSKMIFASSYIYGEPNYLPVDENHAIQAHNPYAQSKLIGEQLCQCYNRDFGVPCIVFRPFNVYGPKMNENFLIPTIINQFKNGKIQINDSRPKRDFVNIDDMVEAYILTLKYNPRDLEIFNIASGMSYSPHDIVQILNHLLDKEISLVDLHEYRNNEILNTVGSYEKAKQILGWQPKVKLEDGIKKMIDFYHLTK